MIRDAADKENGKMKEENLDRRVRKTRRQLRQCLSVLLKEKKIQEITVREISDMADINRGTFYLHYKDVFDLLEQIEHELLEELEDVLNHYQADDLLSKPAGIFTEVFSLVKENADMVAILIGDNGDLNFVNQLNLIVRDKCLNNWMELNCSREAVSFDAYFSFIVSGYIGIVQYWLKNGMRETPRELALMTAQIMQKGIHILEPDGGFICGQEPVS